MLLIDRATVAHSMEPLTARPGTREHDIVALYGSPVRRVCLLDRLQSGGEGSRHSCVSLGYVAVQPNGGVCMCLCMCVRIVAVWAQFWCYVAT